MTLKEQVEQLKEQRTQEILNDTTLSKIEKLSAIESEKLWGYAKYVQNEFREWELDAIELERIEAQRRFDSGEDSFFYQSKLTDSIYDPSTFMYDKYSTVSYADSLKTLDYLNEDEEDNEDYDPNVISVITTREPIVKVRKTIPEVIDAVFDYAVANKIVGFKMDW